MKNLHARSIALVIAFLPACAHSPDDPKLDRSSDLDLSSVAKRFGVPRCTVSVPLAQEDVLRTAKRSGDPHPEDRPEWAAMVEAIEPGDQLRRVICLKTGKNGLAAGDIFYGLFRDGAMVAEMHTMIIN